MSASKTQKIVVAGQGYVGLPLAVAASEAGYDVEGIDLDEDRVARLAAGVSDIAGVDSNSVSRHIETGAYRISTDYSAAKNFSTAIITVPTPLKGGKPDPSFIENSARALAPFVTRGALVVLESTTFPGCTEELVVPSLEAGSGLRAGNDFFVGYSPERIDPGNPDWNLLNTPKLVSGVDDSSSDATNGFYVSLGIPTVRVASTREAEFAKLWENTFRQVNIALVNELSVLASAVGVNIWEVINAASTKPFGFMRFVPGPGVGGHCLPIDPSYLSWHLNQKTGKPLRFVDLANVVNDEMAGHVTSTLEQVLGVPSFHHQSIQLIGLAYKKNIGDVRESPALRIADTLRAGGAKVSAYDPLVPESAWPLGIRRSEAVVDGFADAIVILTNHDIVDLNSLTNLRIPILDTRNCLTGPNVKHL